MNKYKNHVFLSICETSLKLFPETKFMTYVNYCGHMRICLETGTVRGRLKTHLFKLFDMLELIYGMDADMASGFIGEYFRLENIFSYQRIVVLTQEMFPMSYISA